LLFTNLALKILCKNAAVEYEYTSENAQASGTIYPAGSSRFLIEIPPQVFEDLKPFQSFRNLFTHS
jgi:hypothetical protein